ncbi:MAG TPA: hypothetical protein VMV98_05930 [Acidobacteriaceae bacterium]|nr:hypothetical protein [Acidobacteriaceae bacterium]
MPIPRVTRRNFLSSAALSSAALGWLPRSASAEAPNSSRSEADWFSSQTEWDSASFNHLLRARRTVKQLFDVTAPDGETLTDHVHNALTGLERGFGIPKEKILVVAALRASATILNFDDYAWKKYQLGAGYKVKDPATGKPAERNIYFASTISPDGRYASDDPNDPRSIESDSSLQALQRRGVQQLCCHAAVVGTASYAVKRLKLQVSQETVARDLLAHLLPGVLVVPSMVSAIPLLETHGRFAYLRL